MMMRIIVVVPVDIIIIITTTPVPNVRPSGRNRRRPAANQPKRGPAGDCSAPRRLWRARRGRGIGVVRAELARIGAELAERYTI